LVPFENHLDIHIYAGEKKYKWWRNLI
jgi:hypothetical protein